MGELLEITGWTKRQLHKTMGCMTEDGRVIPAGQKGRYALNRSETPDLDGQHAGAKDHAWHRAKEMAKTCPELWADMPKAADRGHAVEFILHGHQPSTPTGGHGKAKPS